MSKNINSLKAGLWVAVKSIGLFLIGLLLGALYFCVSGPMATLYVVYTLLRRLFGTSQNLEDERQTLLHDLRSITSSKPLFYRIGFALGSPVMLSLIVWYVIVH